MKKSLHIVKIGGKLIEDQEELSVFLSEFAALEGLKILVHGGGNTASDLERKLGLHPKVIDGRRVTDKESLEVVVMVYGGLLNKKLVAGLQGLGCNAIGLSGADGDLIRAKKRTVKEIDYGFAGDILRINTDFISSLLQIKVSPVLCALTHDGNGQLLNTNADTIAAELAIALSELFDTSLYLCFDKIGVLSDPDDDLSLIEVLNRETYKNLAINGKISTGMLPKLKNAYNALEKGVSHVILGSFRVLSDPETKHTAVIL